MHQVSPLGPMYQAGTLSGNPLGMAAGIATLAICKEPGFYESLHEKAVRLCDGFWGAASTAGIAVQIGSTGGMFGMMFSEKPVQNFDDAQAGDHDAYSKFFHAMLDRGVWLPPSGYEAMFISAAHDDASIEEIIAAARESFLAIRS